MTNPSSKGYPPVLTFADLTPPLFDTPNSKSMSDVEKYKTFKSRLNLSNNQKDHTLLQKKMLANEEENSILLMQNKKLMNELENASFCMQQCRLEIKELHSLKDQVWNLDEELKKKNYTVKELEKLVVEIQQHKCKIEDHNENLKLENELLNQNMKSLKRHSENLEVKVDQLNKRNNELLVTHENNLTVINKLTAYNKEINEKHAVLFTENKEFCKKAKETKGLNLHLQEELGRLKSELSHSQYQQSQYNVLTEENSNLKFDIKKKEEKILDNEEDIKKLKEQISHLENLCEGTKDESLIKDKTLGFPSFSNSDVKDSHSLRAFIADLQLRLAMKDAEINRLQTTVLSSSQQKTDSFNFKEEKNSSYLLRTEITVLTDKIRNSDKLRSELDQKIAQQHEDILRQSSQLIELTGKLAEKDILIDSFENKLNERNNKLFQLQREKEQLLQQQITNKEMIQSLSSCLKSQQEDHRTMVSDLEKKSFESSMLAKNYSEKILHLENSLLAHDEETKATDSLVTKIKLLHGEHCKELEQQIEVLQEKLKRKILKAANLEKKIEICLKDGKTKNENLQQLQEYVVKMEQLLKEKNYLVEQYKEKLQKLSSSETSRVLQCEAIIDQCKANLELKCKELESKEFEYKNKLLVMENELKSSKDSIQYLNAEVGSKKTHIEDLQKSCEENFKMLQESNKRIAELEDGHEEEYVSLRQSSLHDQTQLQDELTKLKTELSICQKEMQLYKSQVQELNKALEDAKLQFVTFYQELEKKEGKLTEQIDALKKKESENFELNKINSLQVKELSLKENKIKELVKEISSKEGTINLLHEERKVLNVKLKGLEEECDRISSSHLIVEKSFKEVKKEILMKQEVLSRFERMLSISQDGLNIKEKELNDCHMKINELQELLDEQQWNLKEKAARFTQLDMNLKQQQSEWQSKVEQLQLCNSQMEKQLEEKSFQLKELTQVGSDLKRELNLSERRCQELQELLKIQEDENLHSTTELRLLKQELEKCQIEFKRKIDSEIELAIMKQNNEINQLQHKLHTANCENLDAQKTAADMSQELENLRNILSLKEKDCSRLARELGASQVRESQERARLNQELTQASKYHQLQIDQQNEQLDSLRGDLDLHSTSHQQQILNLQLQLQRKSDEHLLCERDLERCKLRTNELEDYSKISKKELQTERGRCRELQECLVLKEAEIARLSARISGFERSLYSQRNVLERDSKLLRTDQNSLLDSLSDKSKDTFLPLSAGVQSRYDSQKESNTQRMRVISPVRELTFEGLDETMRSSSNDISPDSSLTSIAALSMSSFST